jgi:hypothetical protein
MRVTIALNESKDGLLTLSPDVAFLSLADVLVLLFAADVRLVGLDNLAVAAKWSARLGCHRFPNAMAVVSENAIRSAIALRARLA